MNDLNHHAFRMPRVQGLYNRPDGLEVWDDAPKAGRPPCVSIALDAPSEYVDLTPNEARLLAAMLINAAEHQERRSYSAADRIRETHREAV